ncbi:MAG: DUF72 domain-containing protein [Promethearchaeota archaeon]|jgi:uncharacterized protein YecE (DUF72 family)
MVDIKIGTAGWDYKDWIGPFYPKNLEKSQHLTHFSKFFDLVEINSTFYNLPSESMVLNWNNRVPDKFRFIVKVWQKITHKLSNPDLDSRINDFFLRLEPLKKLVVGFLLQFPPWFNYTYKHLIQLKSLLKKIPSEHVYIIELRNNSWFDDEILHELIDGENKIIGTTYMPGVAPFYYPNQKIYYIRLIGDRELSVFNRIQRGQKESLEDLKQNVQILKNSIDVREIFIIVNNHFQGFAPESVGNLKRFWGLQYRQFNLQKSLTDFF